MRIRPGKITGVICKPLKRHNDDRGWLCELFRNDELPADCQPAMAYLSETAPGVARGPHEHIRQTDCFCFLGPSDFRIYLWDNRSDAPTYGNYQTFVVGQSRPSLVIIPPGIVHAYRNVGHDPGLVFNCPDQLYQGPHRSEEVDEIRHEDDPNTIFVLPEIEALHARV